MQSEASQHCYARLSEFLFWKGCTVYSLPSPERTLIMSAVGERTRDSDLKIGCLPSKAEKGYRSEQLKGYGAERNRRCLSSRSRCRSARNAGSRSTLLRRGWLEGISGTRGASSAPCAIRLHQFDTFTYSFYFVAMLPFSRGFNSFISFINSCQGDY